MVYSAGMCDDVVSLNDSSRKARAQAGGGEGGGSTIFSKKDSIYPSQNKL